MIITAETVKHTATNGFELSTNSTGPFTATLSHAQNVAHGVNTNVFVRAKASSFTGTVTGSVQHTAGGITKTVGLSVSIAAPSLFITPTSLTGFTTTANQPSATKSFNFTASNLANEITASITAPTGYEISVQGTTTFSASLTLTQTSTGVISEVILVRLKAQAVNTNVAGNISIAASGLTGAVSLSGKVTTALIADDTKTGDDESECLALDSGMSFIPPYSGKCSFKIAFALNRLLHVTVLEHLHQIVLLKIQNCH